MSGYTFDRHSKYCTLRFTPELCVMPWKDVDEVAKRVTQLVHDDPSHAVLVDLSALTNVPSGVVAALVRTWKGMEVKSRKFVVVSTHESVTNELNQTGLTSLWTMTEDHADAYKALGVSAPKDERMVESTDATATPPVISNEPFVFEEQKLFCAVQMNPVLMEMDWEAVATATTEVIEKIKHSGEKSVLVDISPMRIINSGLVASLVRIWKACTETNRQFSLVSPNEMVTEVLKSAGLWKLWSVVDDREEAVYDLGVSEGAQVEQRERRVLALVAVPCALISVLALGLMYMKRNDAVGTNAQLNALLMAAAAVATGLVSVFKDKGVRRILSGAAVAVGLLVLSTLWFHGNPVSFGRPPAPRPQPVPQVTSSVESTESEASADSESLATTASGEEPVTEDAN